LKIKRSVVEDAYAGRFAEWSGRREALVWHD
jgi:hypothetical protein